MCNVIELIIRVNAIETLLQIQPQFGISLHQGLDISAIQSNFRFLTTDKAEPMRSLIVDDNAMSRLVLKELLSKIASITVIGEFEDAPSAFDFLNKNETDLIFLDVEMPGMSGVELVKALTSKPLIIFTTSQKKYAVEAFELNIADYLIKPFDLPRLLQAVSKATELFSRKNTSLHNTSQEMMFIRENKTIRNLKCDEIFYLEAMGDYVKIHMKEKWHVVHSSLKQLEEKCDGNRFIRIHRSYMVAVDKIESIEEGLISINGASLPIADSYKSALIKKLNPV